MARNENPENLPSSGRRGDPPTRVVRRGETRAVTGRPILRYSLFLCGIIVLIACGLVAFHRVEQFLIGDQRFFLPAPLEYARESPNIELGALRYASRAEILRVFAQDYGRSLYLFPLKRRRNQLLAVDWVRDASISKIWPNRMVVRITERTPVAFLEVPAPGAGGASNFAMIDADGMILRPRSPIRITLPVLVGIRPGDSINVRGERTRRMIRLMDALGPLGERVSEVNVSEPENLKITAKIDNRALTLLLGDHNFALRLKSLLNHYPEIRRQRPDATVLDLRVDDRITVVQGKGRG